LREQREIRSFLAIADPRFLGARRRRVAADVAMDIEWMSPWNDKAGCFG